MKGDVGITKTWDMEYTLFNTHINALLYAEGDYTIDGDDNTYAMSYGIEQGSALLCVAISFMLDGECWIAIGTLTTSASKIGKNLHCRMWAYFSENDAKNADISPTANVAKSKLVFTSDENYPKFIGDGKIPRGGTYEHSLGYKPLTKTWQGQIMNPPDPRGGGSTVRVLAYAKLNEAYFGPMESASLYNKSMVVRTTDNQIITYYDETVDYEDTYYRIYSI
jgi:hypothetical protein